MSRSTTRRMAAQRKITRRQAATNKRLKERGETLLTGKSTQLKRKGSFKWGKGEGKYAYAGDTTYNPKTRRMAVLNKRKRKKVT